MDPSDPSTSPPVRALIDHIRSAAAEGRRLRIRGGGTKDFYGEPPSGELLDTRGLHGILSYEPSELVVTAYAGTPLAELESALAEQGQCLAFEPPRLGGQVHAATVGGMVASGLAGPARASAGGVRDYVLGTVLIDGRAQRLRFGGQVMKNVAGYDVSRLLAGSLGVLGVLTELSLKVMPAAPGEATLEFHCPQTEALRLLNTWGGQPLPLSASCWTAHGNSGQETPDGLLRLRLRGAVAAVETACRQLGGVRADLAEAAAHWTACRDQRLPFFSQPDGCDLWRVSVPQAAPVLGLDSAPLIEWHGGQRWYRLPPDQALHVREAARAAGGHATLFLPANPAANSTPRFDALDAPILRIHRALKREFDPQGIFNPGRLHPDF